MSADYVGEAAFRVDPETMRLIIETHNMEKVHLRMRIGELEAVLRESELIMTALAMHPGRKEICADEKLSAALIAARLCLCK